MADVEESDEEVFQDAEEGDDNALPAFDETGLLPEEEVTSDKTIEDVALGETLFLNNNFLEAQALFSAKSKRSLYHSVGYSTILAVRAVMTMEQEDIDQAYEQLKQTLSFANVYRRKQSLIGSLASMMKGTSANSLRSLTKNQIHAELIYAEAVLLKAVMTVLHDEGFMSLIKSGVGIRTSWMTYRACTTLWQEEREKTGSADELTKTVLSPHFYSGVCLGSGGFNLMLSLMPSKFLKLIEFVGFSASRDVGNELLGKGGESPGLRGPLCQLARLLYSLVLGTFFELEDIDYKEAEEVLKKLVQQYPTGALTLYFQGKMSVCLKDAASAIAHFERAISQQLVWKQLHHICFWELAWSHCFLLQWSKGAEYAARLLQENKWSKSVYAYMQASFLLMNGDSDTISDLMKQVAVHKQKLAGRSLPIEKFVIRKARKYQMQNRYLLLPALELLYVWGFSHLYGGETSKVLQLISKELERLRPEAKTWISNGNHKKYAKATTEQGIVHIGDDYLLALLLKATLERESNDFDGSLATFEELFANVDALTLDHYIAPFAYFERAKLRVDKGQFTGAREDLNMIKTFSKFSNEQRLVMRIHVINQQIEEKEKRK